MFTLLPQVSRCLNNESETLLNTGLVCVTMMSGLHLSQDYATAFLLQVSRKMAKLNNQGLRLRCLKVILAILKRQANVPVEGELRAALLQNDRCWSDLEATATQYEVGPIVLALVSNPDDITRVIKRLNEYPKVLSPQVTRKLFEFAFKRLQTLLN
jgi:hypothetical protein